MEGKNKLMMIVIIVLLVVLIGAVVGLTLFSMRAMNSNANQEENRAIVEQVVNLTQEEITEISLSSAITTNLLAGVDGKEHSIRISLIIGVNNKDKTSAKMVEMLTGKELVMRSFALDIINTKTYQELSRPEGKEKLKNDILVKLQEEFNTNLIVSVSIYDILLN